MNNEETVFDNQMNNNEETVVDNSQNNEDTVVDNQKSPNSANHVEKEAEAKIEKNNKRKRVAAVAVGTAAAGTAAAGVYFMNKGEENETEDNVSEPVEQAASSSHTNSETQPHQHSEYTHESQPHSDPTPEPQPQLDPTPEPQPHSDPTPEPQPVVEVEPEVEIIGVEVVHTEDCDITIGGVTVNDENYVLFDVNSDDFDIAWHDDNHDHQIQATELIDISEAHISVSDFVQAVSNQEEDNTNDNLVADNDMESINSGEIDNVDTSEASVLV